jgi:hypothetical protein
MQRSTWFCLVAFTIAVHTGLAATTGDIGGTAFTVGSDGNRSLIAGATVLLMTPSSTLSTTTDRQGGFSFREVEPSTYQIEASAPGLAGSHEVTVVSGTTIEVPVELQPEALTQSVTVSGTYDAPQDSTSQSVIANSTVVNAPNKYDQFQSLLPLVPGVVRGPDGLINMKGARSSQAGALVNGAGVTDPSTGNPAINLPIDVVESIKVISNPYDPEYGRLAGAVSEVETKSGNFDDFHWSIQNLFVRPRKRSGDFVGIESATPRFTATGPIVKRKIAFTESFEYRFVRIPINSLPPLERDMKLEGFNSFSQMDVNLTQRQSLTASFALYPQKYNYLGLNTFTPQVSTPNLHQRGYMAAVQHRYQTGDDSLLVSQFSYKRFDADTTANSAAPYELRVETTEGGYFNLQNRRTYRTEWSETWQFAPRNFIGSHHLKAGLNYAHSNYDGRVDLLPVAIVGVSNVPIQNITFSPASRFAIHQNETAWFLGDTWAPSQRLTIDLGVRFDRDSVTSSTHAAPRAGFALLLTKDAKTLLKGGAGLFYDRVPLNIVSFPLLPDRTVSELSPEGQVVESTNYANTVTDGRLRNPRSVAWNVELERQVTSGLTVRAGYQQRSTTHDFRLTPELALGQGVLSLSNAGGSFYREFQVAGQYKIRRGALNASYVRSKAFGDLNDFNQFFGNNATAVIEPDQRARLPFDAPNRFLLWGQFEAPFKLTVLPVLDAHTGFPWSVVDQYRDFVGARDSQRFGRFHSFDMQVTRPVSLPFRHKDVRARVGFSVYNLFNSFNPRDVQNNIDSVRYNEFFNSVGRTFRGKFVLEF